MFSQQFIIVIIRSKLLCHIHDPFQIRQFIKIEYHVRIFVSL